MIDDEILQNLIDYLQERKDNNLDCHAMVQHDWMFNHGIPRSQWQLYFNRANPPKINEDVFSIYKSANADGFEDYDYTEENFFSEWNVPKSHWEEYRWRANAGERKALAERKKRVAEALTVGQLIERLKEFPPEMLACVRPNVGFIGINRLSIVKNLKPHYNSYYQGAVSFKTDDRVDVVFIDGLTN